MVQDTIEPMEFQMPQSPEDYRKLAEELRGKGLDVLDAKESAADQRKEAITYLKETYGLNGQAESVISDLELFHQEAEAKKEWSTWDYVKYPFVKTWEVVKAHPYLTAAALTVALGAGAYYTGALTPAIAAAKEWIASLGFSGAAEAVSEKVAEGVAVGKDAISGVTETAEGLLEKVPEVLPNTPPPVTPAPPAPVPNVVPSVDEAEQILRALENSG